MRGSLAKGDEGTSEDDESCDEFHCDSGEGFS